MSKHTDKPPSQAALGRALGLSPAAITKLKGQGMPVHSVEAAQAWRAQNIRLRINTVTPAQSAVQEVERLGIDLAAHIEELRRRYLALPPHLESRVRLPLEVWDALTGWGDAP